MGYSVEGSGGGEVGDGTWASIEGGDFFAADYKGVACGGQVSVMGVDLRKEPTRMAPGKFRSIPAGMGRGRLS